MKDFEEIAKVIKEECKPKGKIILSNVTHSEFMYIL